MQHAYTLGVLTDDIGSRDFHKAIRICLNFATLKQKKLERLYWTRDNTDFIASQIQWHQFGP